MKEKVGVEIKENEIKAENSRQRRLTLETGEVLLCMLGEIPCSSPIYISLESSLLF
jgi:hypothetical protein